jgi:hypothetical protein
MLTEKEIINKIEIQLESSNKINDELRRRIEELERKIDLNKENESKFARVKKRTSELLEVSTSHGIPNIVRTKSLFILIMWSIFTVLSACTGSFFVLTSILDYLKYDTVTKIDVINEKEVQFPAVSLCARPSFNTTINEIVIKSHFDDIFQSNFSDYFDEYNDVIGGKCFRYNSGKNIYNKSYDIQNSTIKGLKYGFRLILNIQNEANYDYVEVALFIHNQSLPPIDLNDRTFWLMSGSLNFYRLERVYNKKLDAPYSNCLNDVNLFQMNKTIIDFLNKEKRAYTQDDCFYKCSHLFALEESNCGCNSSLNDFRKNCITSFYNRQIFDTEKGKCVSEYLKEFRKKLQDKKCAEYCPLECDSMNYVINSYTEQIALSGNVSEKSKQNNLNFSTYEEVKKNHFEIRIYYNELKYTLISEEPKTEMFNFISNIGGILGLFLGISFLSFIEIFEIIFEIMFIFFKN